jgi:hypothetical protein
MAAGSTYTPIATTTLGSAAASYTFSSIPSTYTDLVLIAAIKGTSTIYRQLTVNGDNGSNYSITELTGDGSATGSSRQSNATAMGMMEATNSSSDGTAISVFNFMNYANTSTYKTVLTRSNKYDKVAAIIGLWRSTAAINSITLTAFSNTYAIGSTFTLYGIAAA